MLDAGENKPPVLHILVVGFHHKLGCQVEFSYPPLIAGSSGKNECPSGWKYLPTLALPDGSHNFVEDAVFFNLPSLTEPTESVYGVSCYRQIPVEKLKIRTADLTRSTVQKSVCVLMRLPIYGYIEVKLSLIADAFFDQGDFSCTDILVKAYQQLNACLLDDESRRLSRHFYVGLPLREIVLHWRHKTLILFKLFLLQRKVVCYGSPVRGMCTLILGIASLIPRLLEKGFQEVACVRTSRPLSPMPDFTDSIQREAAAIKQEMQHQMPRDDVKAASKVKDSNSLTEAAGDPGAMGDALLGREDTPEKCPETAQRADHNDSLTRETSVDSLVSILHTLALVNPDDYRAPITIFASGNLCLPYLSLPYMDLLGDPSVLSYVIGTSNILFQQKRHLADALVDIENGNIDALDGELRRQLALSTEDLRFMDYLLKHVQAPKEDAEGSEQWIRDQFQGYILALLRTAVACADFSVKDNDYFNALFMHAFKRTQCYQEWYDVRPDEEFFEALPVGHPFAGTLSVADMKLKIAQTMQNSESGRKLNQAVNTTSRAVGGAISQAKGAFSNWWSSITTAPTLQSMMTNVGAVSTRDDADDLSAAGEPAECVSIHLAEETMGGAVVADKADSAEELEDDGEARKSAKDTDTEPLKGIVEIGREAEILDKNGGTMAMTAAATPRPASCSSTDATAASDHANGEIFIV